MSISHIEQVHTRWSLLLEQIPLVVLNGLGTAAAMLGDDPVWFLGYAYRILFGWALFRYLSYGGLIAWSIWTMPSILRIFPYQTDASLLYLGHCGSYDQGVDLSRAWWPATLWGGDLSRRMSLSCNASPSIRWSWQLRVGQSWQTDVSREVPVADVLGISQET